MDIDNAFLQGDLHEEIYMTLPQGFLKTGSQNLVCRLHKSLCGLKQTFRAWNHKLTSTLIFRGFQ